MGGSTQPGRIARGGGAHRRPGGIGTLVLLTVGAGGAGTALLLRAAALAPRTAAATAGLTVDRWVELAVLVAGLAAAAWLVVSGALALGCVAASRVGRRWRAGEAAVERLAPAAVRRLVRSAVGVGVGAGLALAPTAALAADVPPAEPAAGPSVVLDLGWQPTTDDARPASPVTEEPADTAVEEVDASPVARTTTTDAEATHVVLRGDTLWGLAARHLGGNPTDAEVLREVTRWHDVNRDVIGADPDRLLPGQILRVPA
jgi:resuscitation-promoting factor RpfA